MARILPLLYFRREIVVHFEKTLIKSVLIIILLMNTAIANATCEHYVFISLSMPKQSLLQLLQQSRELNAQVVLRGFVNDSHKTTTKVLQDLITIAKYGVIVDPELFNKYEVKQVPTFVIASSDNHYDKLSGNISWSEAINIVKRRGDVYAAE